MQQRKRQWAALAMAGLLLAAGCAARSPAGRPEQGFTASGTGQAGQGTGGAMEGAGTAGGTGAGVAATGSTTGDADACAAALGNTVGDQAEGDADAGGGADARGGMINANGVLVGNVAVVALPTTDAAAPGGVPATKGTAAVPSPNPAAPGQGALDRVRQACSKVIQIRVVTDPADREQLARITRAIRRGDPITDYLDQLARISLSAAPQAGAGTVR